MGEADETEVPLTIADCLDVSPIRAKGSVGTSSLSGTSRKGKYLFQTEPDKPYLAVVWRSHGGVWRRTRSVAMVVKAVDWTIVLTQDEEWRHVSITQNGERIAEIRDAGRTSGKVIRAANLWCAYSVRFWFPRWVNYRFADGTTIKGGHSNGPTLFVASEDLPRARQMQPLELRLFLAVSAWNQMSWCGL